jgi:hypothetical protein
LVRNSRWKERLGSAGWPDMAHIFTPSSSSSSPSSLDKNKLTNDNCNQQSTRLSFCFRGGPVCFCGGAFPASHKLNFLVSKQRQKDKNFVASLSRGQNRRTCKRRALPGFVHRRNRSSRPNAGPSWPDMAPCPVRFVVAVLAACFFRFSTPNKMNNFGEWPLGGDGGGGGRDACVRKISAVTSFSRGAVATASQNCPPRWTRRALGMCSHSPHKYAFVSTTIWMARDTVQS